MIEHIQEAQRLLNTLPSIMRELYNADTENERNAWAVIYDARIAKANNMLDLAIAQYPVVKNEPMPTEGPVQVKSNAVAESEPVQQVATESVDEAIDTIIEDAPKDESFQDDGASDNQSDATAEIKVV